MKTLIKTIITFLIAIIIIYVCYGTFLKLNANIGSLWINVDSYYIIALGSLLPFLFFSFKKILRIPYIVISILLLLYILLMAFDALNNLAHQSLTIYILLLFSISFVMEKFVKKQF